MTRLTVWVLAKQNDPALPVLAQVPRDVALVVGPSHETFANAPAPDAILVCSMGRETLQPVFELAHGVRWVHSRSAGVDHLLFPALANSSVPLTNGRGLFSPALAEFVIAAVLFFAKGFRRMIASQAAGSWDPFDLEMVAGQTLAIVGYGDIGRAVAERARAMDLRVIALRRRPERSADDALVQEVLPFEERVSLMRRADVVVVATPLTPETRGLIGEAEIGAMKQTAIFINVGRGPVVDEAALVRALDQRRIRGAALDVFENEPLAPGHPFYRLENVLLSPHCADHTPGWLEGAMTFFVNNLTRFRAGQPLLNIVDKQRGY